MSVGLFVHITSCVRRCIGGQRLSVNIVTGEIIVIVKSIYSRNWVASGGVISDSVVGNMSD